MSQTIRFAALVLVSSLGASFPAKADAIDGSWCDAQGEFFEIRGSSITTRGGRTVSGTYTRHTFVYLAPGGEAEAGRTINMALVDDETLHVLVEGSGQGIKVWRRCTDRVS
jgi:hypothetical protein